MFSDDVEPWFQGPDFDIYHGILAQLNYVSDQCFCSIILCKIQQ